MKLKDTKSMVLPGLGVGTGMLASPKVAGLHPLFGKHPYLPPIILLLLALILFGYGKARPFAIGLGAVALVFLVIAIWGKVSGKLGAPAEPGEDYSWRFMSKETWEKLIGRGDYPNVEYV